MNKRNEDHLSTTAENRNAELTVKSERLTSFLNAQHPIHRMSDATDRIAFGNDGALLINLALWKIRNGSGPVFELPLTEPKELLYMGRQKQDTTLKGLIRLGVFVRLPGGPCNTRRFQINTDRYVALKSRAEGHREDPRTFLNKFDDDRMAEYKRGQKMEEAEQIADTCLRQAMALEASLDELQNLIKEIDDLAVNLPEAA